MSRYTDAQSLCSFISIQVVSCHAGDQHTMIDSPWHITVAAFLTQSVNLDESTTIKFEIWDTVNVLFGKVSLHTNNVVLH